MYAQAPPLPIPTHIPHNPPATRFHTLAFSPKSSLGLCNSPKMVNEVKSSSRNCSPMAAIRCGGSQDMKAEKFDDAYYMRRCVELARTAIGCTSPNPMVGCVIVKNGEIVGEGFHPKAGQPHAEVKLEFDF